MCCFFGLWSGILGVKSSLWVTIGYNIMDFDHLCPLGVWECLTGSEMAFLTSLQLNNP